MTQKNLSIKQKFQNQIQGYQKGNHWGGINWEDGINTYTLLCIKLISNKDTLYSTGRSIQYSIIIHMGKKKGLENKQTKKTLIFAQGRITNVMCERGQQSFIFQYLELLDLVIKNIGCPVDLNLREATMNIFSAMHTYTNMFAIDLNSNLIRISVFYLTIIHQVEILSQEASSKLTSGSFFFLRKAQLRPLIENFLATISYSFPSMILSVDINARTCLEHHPSRMILKC